MPNARTACRDALVPPPPLVRAFPSNAHMVLGCAFCSRRWFAVRLRRFESQERVFHHLRVYSPGPNPAACPINWIEVVIIGAGDRSCRGAPRTAKGSIAIPPKKSKRQTHKRSQIMVRSYLALNLTLTLIRVPSSFADRRDL